MRSLRLKRKGSAELRISFRPASAMVEEDNGKQMSEESQTAQCLFPANSASIVKSRLMRGADSYLNDGQEARFARS